MTGRYMRRNKLTQTVSWHIGCLANQANSIKKLEIELERLQTRISDYKDSYAFYSSQIDRALTEHKTSFDSERYGVKRRLDKQA